jgi:L-ascorbate metabolism protein UlaG (beta-lactamase superfamily)
MMKPSRLRLYVSVVFCVSVISCATFGSQYFKERLKTEGLKSNYRDGVYHNTIFTEVAAPGTALKVFWKFMTGWNDGGQTAYNTIINRTAASYSGAVPDFRITWLAHSMVLIEIDGVRILTDPIFSERPSPFPSIGPKRFHPLPIDIDELPRIDAVIVSHDHYDHFDYQSVIRLAQKGVSFYVPLDVGTHLLDWGVPKDRIIEFDWWDQRVIKNGVMLMATPARHFSGRLPPLFNKTLWASWVIAGPRHRVFFCGDSGMLPEFLETGKQFGPFDITLIPIGGYDTRWAAIHLNPEEAIEAHRCLRGRILLPIHWGSFKLAFHPWNEPPERLLVAAKLTGIRLVMPQPGEFVSSALTPDVRPWWR